MVLELQTERLGNKRAIASNPLQTAKIETSRAAPAGSATQRKRIPLTGPSKGVGFFMADYDYMGSALGLWPMETNRGDIRIVRGPEKIADEITSVMLIQPGEIALYPSFGLAPELFEPMSNAQPQFWCYRAHETILKHVDGIEQLRVYIEEYPDAYNELKAFIDFIPRDFPTLQTLTFGWFAYRGALFDGDMESFRRSMALNGQPFPIFKN